MRKEIADADDEKIRWQAAEHSEETKERRRPKTDYDLRRAKNKEQSDQSRLDTATGARLVTRIKIGVLVSDNSRQPFVNSGV